MQDKEKKKERGPKFTPCLEFHLPSNATHIAWSKSLTAQENHHNVIREEARKAATHSSYVPKIKIGKRFKHFFDEEVIEARRRAKLKNKRNNHDKKD